MRKPASQRHGPLKRIMRAARREDGVAAIEFGLIVALVFPVFLGAMDMGLAIRQRMQMDQVLHAGAQAAMIPGADNVAIATAITTAASVHSALSGLEVTVAPPTCFCRSAPTVAVSCEADCGAIAMSRSFDLSAQMRYDSLFLGDLLPESILNLQSRLRIEVVGTLGS